MLLLHRGAIPDIILLLQSWIQMHQDLGWKFILWDDARVFDEINAKLVPF